MINEETKKEIESLVNKLRNGNDDEKRICGILYVLRGAINCNQLELLFKGIGNIKDEIMSELNNSINSQN